MVRIGILWPEIGILRRAGDGHALEVSLACRAGLALVAIRRRGRSRWGIPPLVGEAVEGSVPGVLCFWKLPRQSLSFGSKVGIESARFV